MSRSFNSYNLLVIRFVHSNKINLCNIFTVYTPCNTIRYQKVKIYYEKTTEYFYRKSL